MTEYVVLMREESKGQFWYEIPPRPMANSAREAIKVALKDKDKIGEFVAVPARSWQPVKVQLETALKFT